MSRAGTLVLLNGTSSSGKSTILSAFQKTHPRFKFFKIDDWFADKMVAKAKLFGWREENGEHPWLYLTRYVEEQTGRPHFDTETRAYLFREVPTMYEEAKKALESESNVLIDTVFEYDPEYETFSMFFADFNPLKALVYCPLDVILTRAHKRNASGDQIEFRHAFQSFEQFPAIYKLREHTHEVVVDKVSPSSMREALSAAIQDLIENKIPTKYLPALKQFEMDFISRFNLDAENDFELTARHRYDLILNSALKEPTELAAVIRIELAK